MGHTLIFQHTMDKVIAGTKTQTRRNQKSGDVVKWDAGEMGKPAFIAAVYNANGRIRWRVGDICPASPGRGKKSVGKVEILSIRMEKLQNISEEDAIAEGCDTGDWHTLENGTRIKMTARWNFQLLWRSIFKREHRWEENPTVFVLEFRYLS